MKRINDEVYGGAVCSICGKKYMESQRRFYTAIEMGRESLFDYLLYTKKGLKPYNKKKDD